MSLTLDYSSVTPRLIIVFGEMGFGYKCYLGIVLPLLDQ